MQSWIQSQILTSNAARHVGVVFISSLVAIAECGLAGADTGAVIYKKLCADCHGKDGQGVAGMHDAPLYGEESIEELSVRIEETMPDDDPAACVDTDAARVAQYIHREFYSPAARQRKGLVAASRVELARLTEHQHRNAVADLLLHFTPGAEKQWGPRSLQNQPLGLRGEYYQSQGMSKADEKKLQRVDGAIDFDFSEESPDRSIAADQFLIVWTGSLVTRHSGSHSFRIRTQNGARLYLNHSGTNERGKLRDDRGGDDPDTLIDLWVGSGEMRDQIARIYLLGGRQYPIRLEFFKYQEQDASIKLQWKPPHGVWSVISAEALRPEDISRTFVPDAPFPPDDRSQGYARGSDVSPAWLSAISQTALTAADEVVSRLAPLKSAAKARSDGNEEIARFLRRFVRTAFRRPLTHEERRLIDRQSIDGQLAGESRSAESTIRSVVLRTLTSPHFLYGNLPAAWRTDSSHIRASRLALALWDSIPDEELFEAADSGLLTTADQVHTQAGRMLADPRAQAKMRRFFQHWLELEARDIAKDDQLYPEFNEGVVADLRRSLELFLEQVVWSDESDYRELLLADYLLLNDRLASIYSANGPRAAEAEAESSETAGPGFRRFNSADQQRTGVLTHPYLLSAQAYHNNTSPIHRGVFLTRNIVGRSLKPPPIAVAFENAAFAPDLTMREKVTQLTRDRACMACHSVINPLGFVLESYDAVGRWRTSENDKPIDLRSRYLTTEGEALELTSARDLARYAAASPAAHRAFVTQLFEHMTKQSPVAYGPRTAETLREKFDDDGFSIKNLMVEIAVFAATFDRTPSDRLEKKTP